MSKSKGNVISPDEYVGKYGSDAFRLYLMFGFSYVEGGPWNTAGLESIVRFMERVERLVVKSFDLGAAKGEYGKAEKDLDFVRHSTIKRASDDLKVFSFNTAIARLMEFVNAMYKYMDGKVNAAFLRECVEDFVLLIAPFAPHFAEELHEMLGHKESVFKCAYPTCDEKALVRDEYEMAVQVNSRVKAKIVVPADADNKAIEDMALQDGNVKAALGDLKPVKVIVIPKRIVNIVAK